MPVESVAALRRSPPLHPTFATAPPAAVKLRSNLGDRSGALYTAPLVDVVLLLLIFFLFGSNLVLKSGVEVKLPVSSSSLPASEAAHVLTVLGGESGALYLNDERVSVSQLEAALESVREHSGSVILLGDESVSYGRIMGLSQTVLRLGFDLSYATQQDSL